MNLCTKVFINAVVGIFACVVVALVLCSPASAGEILLCKQHGYTADAEKFHVIPVAPTLTEFVVEDTEVRVGDDTFTVVDPESVGLDGLAVTFLKKEQNKLLYLYVNDKGVREVGISQLETDSDAFFWDKSLFTDCSFEKNQVATTTHTNLTSPSLPKLAYVF